MGGDSETGKEYQPAEFKGKDIKSCQGADGSSLVELMPVSSY